MATRPGGQATIDKRRREQADNEPIRTDARKIQKHGDSLYINLPPFAVDVLNSEKGAELAVETHDDRVVVKRNSD
jgi:hypothetical protein